MPEQSIYTYIRRQYGPRRHQPVFTQTVVIVAATLACFFGVEAILRHMSAGGESPPMQQTVTQDSGTQRLSPNPSLARIFAQAVPDGAWRKNLGHSNTMGYVLTACYLLAALCCFVSTGWPGERFRRPSALGWYWWLLALLVLGLGANSQLQLQLLVADINTEFAQAFGGTAPSNSMQRHTLALSTSACLSVFLILLLQLRKAPASAHMALTGLFVVSVLVGLQTVSTGPVAQLLHFSFGAVTAAQLIEGLGIICVLLAAVFYWPQRQVDRTYILQ